MVDDNGGLPAGSSLIPDTSGQATEPEAPPAKVARVDGGANNALPAVAAEVTPGSAEAPMDADGAIHAEQQQYSGFPDMAEYGDPTGGSEEAKLEAKAVISAYNKRLDYLRGKQGKPDMTESEEYTH